MKQLTLTGKEVLDKILTDLRFNYCSCVRAHKCQSCKTADDLERIYMPLVGDE